MALIQILNICFLLIVIDFCEFERVLTFQYDLESLTLTC